MPVELPTETVVKCLEEFGASWQDELVSSSHTYRTVLIQHVSLDARTPLAGRTIRMLGKFVKFQDSPKNQLAETEERRKELLAGNTFQQAMIKAVEAANTL